MENMQINIKTFFSVINVYKRYLQQKKIAMCCGIYNKCKTEIIITVKQKTGEKKWKNAIFRFL